MLWAGFRRPIFLSAFGIRRCARKRAIVQACALLAAQCPSSLNTASREIISG
jgi:hypothetical protein